MLDVLSLLVLLFVGTRLFGGTRLLGRRDVRDHVVGIVRGLRLSHFARCWPVLFGVVLVASVAMMLPVLSWGWWSAIGGVGNPAMGVSASGSGTPLEWLIPAVFLAMLLPALPLFAEAEEQRFRRGAEAWSMRQRARRSVEFGLVHCLIGIPIGVGLALSIGGAYFTWAYLRGYARGNNSPVAGVLESTRAHLAYNLSVFLLIGVGFALGV